MGEVPADASKDDTTTRIARIVTKAQESLTAAQRTETTRQTAADETSTANDAAQTRLTNAETRLAAAKTAYDAVAPDDGERPADDDELAALVAAEIEYAEAYAVEKAARMAAAGTKKSSDDAVKELTKATEAVTKAQAAVDNPAAHAYIFDADNPASALTDAPGLGRGYRRRTRHGH